MDLTIGRARSIDGLCGAGAITGGGAGSVSIGAAAMDGAGDISVRVGCGSNSSIGLARGGSCAGTLADSMDEGANSSCSISWIGSNEVSVDVAAVPTTSGATL
jgi:hypothetical protein